MLNVLVFGFYSKQNAGDELFKDAFKKLFPQYNFIFTDHIRATHLKDIQYVIFGGGSLLDGAPDISADALQQLKSKTICYVGVGGETDIHSVHIDLLKQAKLVALRSKEGYDKVKKLCDNTQIVSDLVFALQSQLIPKRIPKSILILPNISVVPRWDDAHWKHTHFENFKLEFSQVMDKCIQDGYKIGFGCMCTHAHMSDDYATAAIVSSMKHRNNYTVEMPTDFIGITTLFSQYELVISQRYHGIVLAEMTNTPYICISHHDKLSTSSIRNGLYTSYYGLNKAVLLALIDQSKEIKFLQAASSFDPLIDALSRIIVWQDLSV